MLQQRMHLLPSKRNNTGKMLHTEQNQSNMIMELNVNPNFTRYSFQPSSSLEKSESVVKAERGGEDAQNNESMPDTPRSMDCGENGGGPDDTQRRQSRSISNAPSCHDEDMLDNDMDMADKCGNNDLNNQDCSDDNNELPEDDG